MGIFDGCLLACDIDGTLIESGYINPQNIEKIKYFIDEGGAFSLCTGRSMGAISDALGSLPPISPCVVLNGGMIYDYTKGETLFDVKIPKEDYRITEIVKNCGEDVGIEVHAREKVFTIVKNYYTDLHQEYEKFEAPLVDFSFASQYDWNKVLFTFHNDEQREIVVELLKTEKTNSKFIKTCAIIDGKPNSYYEQIPLGVSKATAIDRLCEILNIKKGRVFAIGDYYNDLEMIKKADISAAPVTSPDDLKAFADYITVSCKDGAVADFINYLTNKYK